MPKSLRLDRMPIMLSSVRHGRARLISVRETFAQEHAEACTLRHRTPHAAKLARWWRAGRPDRTSGELHGIDRASQNKAERARSCHDALNVHRCARVEERLWFRPGHAGCSPLPLGTRSSDGPWQAAQQGVEDATSDSGNRVARHHGKLARHPPRHSICPRRLATKAVPSRMCGRDRGLRRVRRPEAPVSTAVPHALPERGSRGVYRSGRVARYRTRQPRERARGPIGTHRDRAIDQFHRPRVDQQCREGDVHLHRTQPVLRRWLPGDRQGLGQSDELPGRRARRRHHVLLPCPNAQPARGVVDLFEPRERDDLRNGPHDHEHDDDFQYGDDRDDDHHVDDHLDHARYATDADWPDRRRNELRTDQSRLGSVRGCVCVPGLHLAGRRVDRADAGQHDVRLVRGTRRIDDVLLCRRRAQRCRAVVHESVGERDDADL
jgi:hypothetical protein